MSSSTSTLNLCGVISNDINRRNGKSKNGTIRRMQRQNSTPYTNFRGVKTEDLQRQTNYFLASMTIEELYNEILFEIIHNVGCDVNVEIGKTALLSYLQDAFKMNNEKHSELMAMAEQKEPPKLLLNVEVIEAKELVAKDCNGLSDPFVTLYLMSDTAHKYNSSVKEATLSPAWEEHFALPMPENIAEDELCVEVWDFDPAETVKEKMGKIGEVKGVKGLRKLIKEIAITATTGQHDNELIGRAAVPLKAIPASGLTMWYSLEKKNRNQRRGLLKLRLAFGSTKNSQVAAQEHKHLLKILLLHELELSKVSEYSWCGTFSPQAEAILTQHSVQSGLTKTELSFVEWSVYCNVHLDHPLSYTLFNNLLDKLIKPIQTAPEITDDIKLFWEATKKILPSCFAIIRKLRKKTSGDKNMMKQLIEVLRLLNKLMTLDLPENIDMFPDNNYSWICDKEEKRLWDLNWTVTQAINQGANHWFIHILENNQPEDKTDEAKLQYLIKITTFVRTDLQKAMEYYDKIFQENINIPYAKTLYSLYEAKLAVIIEPGVKEVCSKLEKLIFPGHLYPGSTQNKVNTEEPLAMGTTLFELYLLLKRFVLLGTGLCPADYQNFAINNFHSWFHMGVAQWLNIAVFKALQIIKKAVEVDNLVPIDSSVKYSSSAVDTLTTFYQVKTFWQQLDWPDVESSYSFIAKIIDDICRCCVFFADEMSKRVESMSGDVQDPYEKTFEVTSEWCLAINNIDYIRQSLRPFTNEMNLEDILNKLSDLRGSMDADRCRQTFNNVIENAIDTVSNKIYELQQTVATKMSPAMKKLLIEGAEILHQDSNSIDRVMRYLDRNLANLFEYLNDENFNRMLSIFWDSLSMILHDIFKTNVDKRRPPSFFANLHETLKMIVSCFKQNKQEQDQVDGECEDLKRIETLLAINGMETAQLIHYVQLDRWREQQSIKNSPFGQLTIKIKFQGNTLTILVMNARNLKPMDSNGLTDSFIRINLYPEEKFMNIPKPKTKIHYKTLFPLFDETFTIELTPEQRQLTDALVVFNVKDKEFIMSNQYIAEAYVHFLEIPETETPISEVPQVHLELHRPSVTDTDAITALEHRQGDKLATNFVKKYKQKIGTPPAQSK